jgi:hypothetical protein
MFRAFRLPAALEESVAVSGRLRIKPLLPFVDRGERFLMLVLGQSHVRFWAVTRSRIIEVPVRNLPENKRVALNYDGADRGEQVHPATRGNLGHIGKQSVVFHGQGGMPDTAKSDIEQFFRVIDRALAPILGHETAPLLLAGVDYLLPIFRQISSYKGITERHLTGNCESLTAKQLYDRGWELMSPHFDRPRLEALDRVRQLLGSGRASIDIAQIVAAAARGRVELLLADPCHDQPGIFDPRLGSATLRDKPVPGGEDLVNSAVADTLVHGGSVFAAQPHEIPGSSPLSAILRY